MATKQFNVRLPEHLHNYLDEVATGGVPKTQFVIDLIEAAKEGRLLVRPRAGVNAFPGHQVEAGTVPEYPVLVTA